MALKAHRRYLEAADARLEQHRTAAGNYRRAYALDVLVAEVDAAAPKRNRASDGWIGDARHQLENGPNGPGSGSDHNPWVKLAGLGIVRAEDITNDPVLDLPTVLERLRARAAAGQLPQVTGGGYLILNGRITAEDWSGWHAYTGGDPHVSHGHLSTSLAPAQFDSRLPWGLFSTEQPAPAVQPAPPPAPAPPVWNGPDLIGAGVGLRGQAAGQDQGPQSNGPRVAALQTFLRAGWPLYAKGLVVDGWYGTQTAGVLAEFAHRSDIPSADGLNIGPKLAAMLTAAGFEQRGVGAARPSARDRVRSHVGRRARL